MRQDHPLDRLRASRSLMTTADKHAFGFFGFALLWREPDFFPALLLRG